MASRQFAIVPIRRSVLCLLVVKYKEMAVRLFLTIFCFVSTSTCAPVTKLPRNETLSVLLLASTAASYNTTPSTLSKWVNDLLSKGAAENWGYKLQLSFLDTKVQTIVHHCKVLYTLVHLRLVNVFKYCGFCVISITHIYIGTIDKLVMKDLQPSTSRPLRDSSRKAD